MEQIVGRGQGGAALGPLTLGKIGRTRGILPKDLLAHRGPKKWMIRDTFVGLTPVRLGLAPKV